MRKRMKGLLSAALAVSVMLSMAACGDSHKNKRAKSDNFRGNPHTGHQIGVVIGSDVVT